MSPTRRTLAAQAMGRLDPASRGIVPAIHVATTYARDEDGGLSTGNLYGRPDNPTIREAEAVIAMLEGAEAALVLGSGMAAISAVFLSLPAGAHVVAPRVMYTGTRNWLRDEAARHGLAHTVADATNLDALRAAVRPGETKLVWIETPANPLWDVVDIAGAAAIAHEAGALLAVDSTTASPVLTRPIEHGADIVVHSATKYLNGHSDVLAGAVALARRDGTLDRLLRLRSMHGGILGPLEAFLLIRGMRTLHLRVAAQCASAMQLAERLSAHPDVARVLYPGLASHPGHAVAARQMEGGFGGMLSIAVHGGEAAAAAVARGTRLWKQATSLGGVESLIEHRAPVEGPGSPCPPEVLRLSVGVEDAGDLYADLDGALRAARVSLAA